MVPPCWGIEKCHYYRLHAKPSFCLVVGCGNDKKRRPDLSFCRVPKVITSQGEDTEILSTERRTRWFAAIICDDLTENILESDCGIHFQSGKAANLWDKFNPDWVSNLHLAHRKLQTTPEQYRITERRKREKEHEEQDAVRVKISRKALSRKMIFG